MNPKTITKSWCNLLETPERILVRRLYEIFMTGCGIPSYGDKYAELLQKLFEKLFKTPKEKFEFVANIACGHILYAVDPKDVISPELQLRSLKLMINFIAVQSDAKWILDSDVFILTVLFDLNNSVESIRHCVIDLVNNLLREEPDPKNIYVQLLKELMTHTQELLLDHEQLPQALKTILTYQSPGNKLFRKNCLLKLTGILLGETPSHIKSSLVEVLSSINNTNTFIHILPAINNLEKIIKQNELDKKFTFNIYESNLFSSVYSQINATTATTFSKEQVWNSIEIGLKEYRECILNVDQTFVSPCVLILKEINEDVFSKVPEEKIKQLIHLITFAGAFSNNPNISSVASKVMKRIHLNFRDFKPILDEMLNAVDPVINTSKKKKTTISMLSYQLSETDEWRLGVTLLEYVQNKKKMSVDISFITLLFQILNKCLRFEEQSYVEYTKQLILSSLWYFCKKFVNDTDKEQVKALAGVFDVELVVKCIRGTQNPQTQHHALIVLSHAAYMLPEQVLHHTMEIFTFIRSSEKCILLIKYIMKTLNIVFLYDNQSFLNKDRFETLMQPVVDQLENTVGGIMNLKARAKEFIIPCIAQFAVATADDSLWKLLNYQILLKTRHNDAEIRLNGLDCLVAMASQLGSNWLPLLAESVPFLAELLEDGDPRIESATKNAVRTLEQILEEPLEKYF